MTYLGSTDADRSGFVMREDRDSGLSTAMLADALRGLRAKRVLMIVDACQSGGVMDSLAKIASVKMDTETRLTSLDGRASHSVGMGFFIIAAATPFQSAAEPFSSAPTGVQHSVFTAALLSVLSGVRTTGTVITAHQLLSNVVGEVASHRLSDQTAFPYGTGIDFPVAGR